MQRTESNEKMREVQERLWKDKSNRDYPCRKCPVGKSLEESKNCPTRCAFWRLWVDKRLENARKVVYGDSEVRYV